MILVVQMDLMNMTMVTHELNIFPLEKERHCNSVSTH
jgi:hypothetical protein